MKLIGNLRRAVPKALFTIAVMAAAAFAGVAEARDFLFYFDVSVSARPDHKAYALEYSRFLEQNVRAGDRVFMLRLDGETYNFDPFARSEIKAPSGGASEKKKREAVEAARADLITALPKFLEKASASRTTSILGALISSADHFNQDGIADSDRIVVIFTDGLEQSAISKIDMERQIPTVVPAGMKLPGNLNASISMIGIRPPNKPGAQEAMRKFWEDAAKKTSSRLVKYIKSS